LDPRPEKGGEDKNAGSSVTDWTFEEKTKRGSEVQIRVLKGGGVKKKDLRFVVSGLRRPKPSDLDSTKSTKGVI